MHTWHVPPFFPKRSIGQTSNSPVQKVCGKWCYYEKLHVVSQIPRPTETLQKKRICIEGIHHVPGFCSFSCSTYIAVHLLREVKQQCALHKVLLTQYSLTNLHHHQTWRGCSHIECLDTSASDTCHPWSGGTLAISGRHRYTKQGMSISKSQ